MKQRKALVELKKGEIVRILKGLKSIYKGEDVEYKVIDRSQAVQEIREAVFESSNGLCRDCGTPITWYTMEMHELVPRGKGGEISLDNSVAVCQDCHRKIEHKNRKLAF